MNKRLINNISICLCAAVFFAATCVNKVYSQEIIDDIGSSIELDPDQEIFTESVEIISRSRKIFIMTNTNSQMGKGDFVTMMINDNMPVARALVAKNHNSRSGLKILKIYSLKRWSMIHQGIELKLLKGDDSALFVKRAAKTDKNGDNERITSEEDLYNENIVDSELGQFNKDNRHIKPDNLVSAGWSRFAFTNEVTENTEINNQWHGAWAFQFADNMWAEGLYGRVLMNDFPATAVQTLINNFTVRLKYNFKAPLYMFVMPYIGYQVYNISSPDAGKTENEQLNLVELAMIKELGKQNIIAGVTILRRLVPGWFLKADIGTDIIDVGFAIEF